MGLKKLGTVEDYWSADVKLGEQPIKQRMSRDRFRLIVRFLHVSDYQQEAAIGEAGFVEEGNLLGSHAVIVCDNFFTIFQLCADMLAEGVHVLGTTRQNYKHWPKALKLSKAQIRRMNRGDSISYHAEGMLACVWKDNDLVYMLCTGFEHEQQGCVVRRRVVVDGSVEKQPINCPPSVAHYNCNMGGVDTADQMRKQFGVWFKGRKWWHKLFVFLLNVTCNNCFIMHKFNCGFMTAERQAMDHGSFMWALVDALFDEWDKDCIKRSKNSRHAAAVQQQFQQQAVATPSTSVSAPSTGTTFKRPRGSPVPTQPILVVPTFVRGVPQDNMLAANRTLSHKCWPTEASDKHS
eukprot:gene1614-1954_t